MLLKFKVQINILFLFILFSNLSYCGQVKSSDVDPVQKTEIGYFLDLIASPNKTSTQNSLTYIKNNWKPEFEIMVIELLYFNTQNYNLSIKLLAILQKKTGKQYRFDFNAWYGYLWNKDQKLLPGYHRFKAELHKTLDSRFENYFLDRQKQTSIRFDEIRWGGVLQDGIPPLRNPAMINMIQASYLNDSDVVFGIEVNGDARAYPKRILAWHEMFTDVVGGISVTGVYCTLCGTVILYKNKHKGVDYKFGTSGFLYRSNKLMYDKTTQSLWNTIWGKPVVGPLVEKEIQLEYESVVTTTWGEWRNRHPDTQVLSLYTGSARDYGEGVAYNNYFSSDELMFNVPSLDKSLKNKQSVLAIRLPEHPDKPYAISVKFLKKHSLYPLKIENKNIIIVTDKSAANRVYEAKDIEFINYDRHSSLTDNTNITWKLSEDRLESSNGETLQRIHTYNAFWFGWKAAYPNTKLIK